MEGFWGGRGLLSSIVNGFGEIRNIVAAAQ
jgi:hypothetical protein